MLIKYKKSLKQKLYILYLKDKDWGRIRGEPDTWEQPWAVVDSKEKLEECDKIISKKGYRITVVEIIPETIDIGI